MIRTYSVELEAAGYADDTFTGDLIECVGYINENGYKLGEDCQIALIELDDNGCVEDTIRIIDSI